MMNVIELFGFNKHKKVFNAESALNLYEYGDASVTLERAVKSRINDINSCIRYNARGRKRSFVSILTDEDKELINRVTKHFKDQGFFVKVQEYEEIPDNKFLVIGW